jgi:hypothetical protein
LDAISSVLAAPGGAFAVILALQPAEAFCRLCLLSLVDAHGILSLRQLGQLDYARWMPSECWVALWHTQVVSASRPSRSCVSGCLWLAVMISPLQPLVAASAGIFLQLQCQPSACCVGSGTRSLMLSLVAQVLHLHFWSGVIDEGMNEPQPHATPARSANPDTQF